MAVAVLMLQAFAVQGGAAGGAAEQEAAGLHVSGSPGEVAHALEAEHGVVDVERNQGEAMGAVGGGGGHPGGEGAGLVDALLQHLPILAFPIGGDFPGILRLVELALGGIDAQLPEHALHAEGAGFVGDDGNDALADALVPHQSGQHAHELHGGGIGPLAGALELGGEGFQAGHLQGFPGLAALRDEAAEFLAALAQIDQLRRILLGAVVGDLLQLLVGEGDVEAVPEVLEALQIELLHLMGVVLRFAGVAHSVALDGLGQDDRGFAPVMDGRMVGGIDLERIMPAPVQPVDVVVGEVLDHLQQGFFLAEQAFPHIGAALGLEILEFAIHGLVHALLQEAGLVFGEQRVPKPAPNQLDDIPAGAAEVALQFLNDLAVAAHRPVQALQIAVDHEDEVVQPLPASHRNGAQGFRLVAFPVADEGPDLAVAHRHQAAAVQILHDVRLIDGLQRPQPHAHRGELPVAGHQPRVGIGGQAPALHLLAEAVQLLLGQPPFQEGAGVDAGRGMALEVDEVSRRLAVGGIVGAAEKVVEAHIIQSGRGREGGNMPAQFPRALVGPHHHSQGIPADQGADAPLHEQVAGHQGFPHRRDGVAIGRVDGVGQAGAGSGHAGG